MGRIKETKLIYALSFAAQLGFLVIAPLIGFIWLGVYLDGAFEAAPTFLLTGLFLGLSVTVYETYHLLTPLLGGSEKDSEANKDNKDADHIIPT